MTDYICACGHNNISHNSNGRCAVPKCNCHQLTTSNCTCGHATLFHCGTLSCMVTGCRCSKFISALPPTKISDIYTDLIKYTADQLDIPYRVSRAGREYCVYYIGKGMIELIIMANLVGNKWNDVNTPWFVTWITPSTTHKETLAKFTDIIALISLLQEGVNGQQARKAEAYH